MRLNLKTIVINKLYIIEKIDRRMIIDEKIRRKVTNGREYVSEKMR